jgi:hypothetical protein
MRGPEELLQFEDHWVTDLGAWFPGERVVLRGKDLLTELADQRWMGLLLYGVTGRLFDDKQVRLFEGLWSLSASFPEPRLWNNRVAALAGTMRSTGALGVGAAIAVSEASIYGRRPDIRAIDLLLRAKTHLDKPQADLEEFIKSEIEKGVTRRALPPAYQRVTYPPFCEPGRPPARMPPWGVRQNRRARRVTPDAH